MENFEPLSDNVKKDILLYGDSRLDGNKTKFILEATLTYIESTDILRIYKRFFCTENYPPIT